MKRICVLSDTHGSVDLFPLFLKQTKEADFYIHLGDYTRDAEILQQQAEKPVYIVRGNNDFSPNHPYEQVLKMENLTILITHGHKYNVKFSMHRLYFRAMEAEANLVLYGHTHVPKVFAEQGIIFMCPGSLGSGFAAYGQTYGLIEMDNGKILPKILKIN